VISPAAINALRLEINKRFPLRSGALASQTIVARRSEAFAAALRERGWLSEEGYAKAGCGVTNKRREYQRKWRAANLEKARERQRKWRAANLEKVREHQRKYQRKYQREYQREYQRKYRAANLEKAREYKRKYESRISDAQWSEILNAKPTKTTKTTKTKPKTKGK
jgi:hypothetical protein